MRFFNFVAKGYYIFLFAFYTLFVFVPQMRIGVVASILSFVAFLTIKPSKNSNNSLFSIFFAWCIIAIFIGLVSDVKFEIIASKTMSFIFPMFFFFIGLNSSNVKEKNFYHYFMIALIYCFLIGIFWYIREPDYYVSFLERTIAGFYVSTYHNDNRFCSFLGSIGIGLMSVCGIVLFLYAYLKTKKMRFLIGFILMLIMCILSMQRSAYIMAVIFIILVLLFSNISKKRKIIFSIVALFIVVIGTAFLPMTSSSLLSKVGGRIDAINIESLFSRSRQWVRPFNTLGLGVIFGGGIGSFTRGSLVEVNDGLYFNLIGEIGFIGLFLFAALIIWSFKKYFTNKKNGIMFVGFLIVLVFLINGIGSNGLLYMEQAPLFWFSLGLINSKNNIKNGLKIK